MIPAFFVSDSVSDLLSILIYLCSQVGRRCKFGPFYRAFRELDDFMAMEVAVVCSVDHKQLDDIEERSRIFADDSAYLEPA